MAVVADLTLVSVAPALCGSITKPGADVGPPDCDADHARKPRHKCRHAAPDVDSGLTIAKLAVRGGTKTEESLSRRGAGRVASRGE